MKKSFALLSLLVMAALALNFVPEVQPPVAANWDNNTPLSEVLTHLGDATPNHFRGDYTAEQVRMGKEIVWEGRTTTAEGKKSRYVSKYFVCTSCHNMEIEDPNLRKSDPEARLDYATKNNIPFLQGTTFYGMVNRESWYNDDYILKYGDLVRPASKSLVEAIQLCAQECSQGRKLETWELEAVLAYSWSIQYSLGDLGLSQEEWKKLRKNGDNDGKKSELLAMVKSHYNTKSPATFVDAPKDKIKGYGMTGNAEKGKAIYDLSCRSCHQEDGVSHFTLEDNGMSRLKLRNNITSNSRFSIYEIIRHGTHSEPGHKAYMPHFTAERMSDQQVEDLRAYLQH